MRISRSVLREAGGEIPPAYSPNRFGDGSLSFSSLGSVTQGCKHIRVEYGVSSEVILYRLR